MSDPLKPGTALDYHGKRLRVSAVCVTGNERYYWLTFDDDSTAMLPATIVEELGPFEGAS